MMTIKISYTDGSEDIVNNVTAVSYENHYIMITAVGNDPDSPDSAEYTMVPYLVIKKTKEY